MTLSPGANAPVPGSEFTLKIAHGTIAGIGIDVAAFLLTDAGKVRSDEDMCFYNQTEVAGGAVTFAGAEHGITTFRVSLDRLPAVIDRVMITATLDGAVTFAALTRIDLALTGAGTPVSGEIPCAGRTEVALLLAELYRRNGAWKVRVVGQGFNGGLAALCAHLGVAVADEPAATPAPAPVPQATPMPVAEARKVDLQKRLVDLEKRDPKLVSLVKAVQVSLEKKKISRDRARVKLVLDISGSMAMLFKSGKIDQLVQRVMALGFRLDDDGEIEVLLFGKNIHQWGVLTADSYKGFVQAMLRKHSLESNTKYGLAMEALRESVRGKDPSVPTFVMFVTDGGTEDQAKTEKMLREASSEPIFWKFMAIGAKGIFGQTRFEFLEKLDDLKGRVVDNADFFQVADPAAPTDEHMFDLMMTEYEGWIQAASAKGILASA